MADWQSGPINESLCRVYEGQILSCIYPKGLFIGKMISEPFQHEYRFFLVDGNGSYCSTAGILAYKVMDP